LLVGSLLGAGGVRAQDIDIGHRLPGTLGVHAGTQPDPGLYLEARLAEHAARKVIDNDGHARPVGFHLNAIAGAVGAGVTFGLPKLSTYVNAAIGLPASHVTSQMEQPEIDIERGGVGDLSVMPIRLGWRAPHLDIVTGYAFYAPTGVFQPSGRSGAGRGEWTHEVSMGGAVYWDEHKTWYASALGSLDINSRRRGIDLTSGTTIEVEGGVGTAILRVIDVGLAAYGLWQLTDDSGADVRPARRGARSRTYGAGPEIDVVIPPIRSRVGLRYEHDIVCASRPWGQLLVLELTVVAWTPATK
jgi:hypothetical protein